MYDLGPAVTGSLCKSVSNGKPESPISLPTWSSRIRVARRASSLRRALVCFCVFFAIFHDRGTTCSRDAVSDIGFGCTRTGFLPW